MFRRVRLENYSRPNQIENLTTLTAGLESMIIEETLRVSNNKECEVDIINLSEYKIWQMTMFLGICLFLVGIYIVMTTHAKTVGVTRKNRRTN